MLIESKSSVDTSTLPPIAFSFVSPSVGRNAAAIWSCGGPPWARESRVWVAPIGSMYQEKTGSRSSLRVFCATYA